MRWKASPVPHAIDGVNLEQGNYALNGKEFLLRGERFSCHYRRHEGVTVEIEHDAGMGEFELALGGSVRAAGAGMLGLYPLHASAVVSEHGLIAFTGASGAGKSTLAAALCARGLPPFADDILLIDPKSAPPLGIPGGKRMKPWPEALKLSGASDLSLVSDFYPKRYASVSGSEFDTPLPVTALFTLEEGPECAVEQVSGAARLKILNEQHFTRQIWLQKRNTGVADHFRVMSTLASSIPFTASRAPWLRIVLKDRLISCSSG